MYYNLMDTKLFGDDEQNSFAEKMNYYISRFPEKFMKLKQNNSKVAQIPIIQMMDIENGRIVLKRSGRLDQQDKDVLTRDLDEMFFSKDPILMQLAFHLFRYSFYVEKLGVDHGSFGNLFSVQFIEQFPEYIEACKRIKDRCANESWLNQFRYFYEINNIDKFAQVVDLEKNNIKGGDGTYIVLSKKVLKKYIAINFTEDDMINGPTTTTRYYQLNKDSDEKQIGYIFDDITDEVRQIRKNEIYYAGYHDIKEINKTIESQLRFIGTGTENRDAQNQGNASAEQRRIYPQDSSGPVEIEKPQDPTETDVPFKYGGNVDNTSDNKDPFCPPEF